MTEMTGPFTPEFWRALSASDEAATTRMFRLEEDGTRRTYRPDASQPWAGQVRQARREIRVVPGGYDIAVVNDLLCRAERALATGSELQCAAARQLLRSADLHRRPRGYARGTVHTLFAQLGRQLGAGPRERRRQAPTGDR